jgi:hypothetical protein
MTIRTQPDQIRQPMRIRPTPPSTMMHLTHRRHPTMLTHPATALPHLFPPCRVHRIPLPSPIGYGLHRISSRNAISNSSARARANLSTSRFDSGIPPALSIFNSTGNASDDTFTDASLPHIGHRHVRRHGLDSNRVSANGTGTRARHTLHNESCKVLSGSSSGKVGLRLVRREERLDGGELGASASDGFKRRRP